MSIVNVNQIDLLGNVTGSELYNAGTKVIKNEHLPASHDNVDAEASLADFPATGIEDRIYIAKDTNKTYRWDVPTTQYVEIGGGGGASIASGYLHEGTLYNTRTGSGTEQDPYVYTNPITLVSGYTYIDIDKERPVLYRYDGTNLVAMTTEDAVRFTAQTLTSAQKAQVKANLDLGNVDNTSDLNKPISTATQTALDGKVDKVTGKGLSTEDYTTAEKTKLSGVETGAEVNIIEGIQKNGTDLTPDANRKVNITVPTTANDITYSATSPTAGSAGAELARLGAKADELGNLENLTTTAKANLVAAINEVNSMPNMIGSKYSPTQAYSVGEFCQYNGVRYKCITAIPTGGEIWNPLHWGVSPIDSNIQNLNTLPITAEWEGTTIKIYNVDDVEIASLPFEHFRKIETTTNPASTPVVLASSMPVITLSVTSTAQYYKQHLDDEWAEVTPADIYTYNVSFNGKDSGIVVPTGAVASINLYPLFPKDSDNKIITGTYNVKVKLQGVASVAQGEQAKKTISMLYIIKDYLDFDTTMLAVFQSISSDSIGIVQADVDTVTQAQFETLMANGQNKANATRFTVYANFGMNPQKPFTSVAANTFNGYTGLTTIAFPKDITTIGTGNFSGNTFTTLDLSRCTKLVSIASGAFTSCTYSGVIDLSHCTYLQSADLSGLSGVSEININGLSDITTLSV